MRATQKKTPLLKISALRKRFGLPKLFIKDESRQLYGTWKDRKSRLVVSEAQRKGIKKLVILTAGNAGYSLAKFADKAHIQVVAVLDSRLPRPEFLKLQHACSLLVRCELSRHVFSTKELLAMARDTPNERILDATNGFERAYHSLVAELKSTKPDYIVCPVGSGEAFVGIADGIRKYGLRTILIGIAPADYPSRASRLSTVWTPYIARIEKLTQSRHRLFRATEHEIKKSYAIAKKHLHCEPSSAIVFSVFSYITFPKKAKIILINSGTGMP
ncbi:MAG: PLP-dependent lyase/thiolase [Patescibacteria group bacterium]